jgi:hypothetical protein
MIFEGSMFLAAGLIVIKERTYTAFFIALQHHDITRFL